MEKRAYEKLMEEHNLQQSDLTDDAKVAIKQLKDIERGMNLSLSRGKRIQPETAKRIKTLDTFITRDILYMLDDEQNPNPVPDPEETKKILEAQAAAKKVEEDAARAKEEEAAKKAKEVSPEGIKCDGEFAEMIKAGKTEVSFEELKSLAPTAYGLIFDAYEDGADNGITTSYYVLAETEKNKYKLSKK